MGGEMRRFIGGIVAGVAGNALFWFINQRIDLLTGMSSYWAMAAIFAILFLAAFVLLRETKGAATQAPQPAATPPSASTVASGLDAGGKLDLDVSDVRVRSGDATIASENKSTGDMKVDVKTIDIG